MKRFLFFFSIVFAAALCSCSGDNGSSASSDENQKQDDLAAIQEALAGADTLNKAVPFVVALPAANLEGASGIYLCLIADSCSYDSANSVYVTDLDSIRLEKSDDGSMSFKMTDVKGELEGYIEFSPVADEESQNLAVVKFSEVSQEISISELDLVIESAWPNNNELNPADILEILKKKKK